MLLELLASKDDHALLKLVASKDDHIFLLSLELLARRPRLLAVVGIGYTFSPCVPFVLFFLLSVCRLNALSLGAGGGWHGSSLLYLFLIYAYVKLVCSICTSRPSKANKVKQINRHCTVQVVHSKCMYRTVSVKKYSKLIV
jgi:hypothetical protein